MEIPHCLHCGMSRTTMSQESRGSEHFWPIVSMTFCVMFSNEGMRQLSKPRHGKCSCQAGDVVHMEGILKVCSMNQADGRYA